MYILFGGLAAIALLFIVYVLPALESPLETQREEKQWERKQYDDPEDLPEDIPFRSILIRNQISPRTLQNWLMREQVREGRQYLENRIHQIGEVRANRIRTWAEHNRVIPKEDEDLDS